MSVYNLKTHLEETLKQIAYYEKRIKEIEVMSVDTPLERAKKNLASEKLHVRILKRMLDNCNRSKEDLKAEFEKLLATVESLRELIF